MFSPFLPFWFSVKGKYLREKRLNHIGNLLVSNENYCLFEEWINPILKEMIGFQKEKGKFFSPGKIIK